MIEQSNQTIKAWATALKPHVMAVWFIVRHDDTPWKVRVLVTITVSYALSPIDLIPDFIPIIGYLDDLIIVPAGI